LAQEWLTVPTDKGVNAGLKVMSLVAGMAAGADSIEGMALLRHGGIGITTPHDANWYAGEDPWQTIYGLPLRLADSARRFDASPAWFSALGAGLTLRLLASLDGAAVETHTVGPANRARRTRSAAAGFAIVSIPIEDAADKLRAAVDDIAWRVRDRGTAHKAGQQRSSAIMRIRNFISPLLVAGASAVAIAVAPLAEAAPTCTSTGMASVCESAGNAQVSATPPRSTIRLSIRSSGTC
jgi:hypothetical protein